MAKPEDFDHTVRLPPGLEVTAIHRAVDYVERELVDFADVYLEQANVFSALVGIFGTRALDSVSNYEKHLHPHTAQQRFPDLCRRGCNRPPEPNHCLESKGSKRPHAIQSHYDHPGWYIVWRYLVDPTESIERDKPIILWRIDVVYLNREDWKYEGSTASAEGGGRTHTFGVKEPAKRLTGCAVYKRHDLILRGGKPIMVSSP
jgi:hypothetical protein